MSGGVGFLKGHQPDLLMRKDHPPQVILSLFNRFLHPHSSQRRLLLSGMPFVR